MGKLVSHVCSEVGRRKNNEDSYIIDEPVPGYTMFAVADGMGGATAGEVASSLAIETISGFFRKEIVPEKEYPDQEILDIILNGFRAIQKAIADTLKDDPSLTGMGTTLVLLLNAKGRWFSGNLGDSRLYAIQKGNAKQLTKDHTLLQQYTDKNGSPPDQDWINKYSNYLVRALDGGDSEPDVATLPPDVTDDSGGLTFLLCSDGAITNKASDELKEFGEILLNTQNIKEAAEQIVSSAYYNGSNDNITVILVEVKEQERITDKGYQKLPFPPVEIAVKSTQAPRSKTPVLIMGSAAIICILGIIFILLKDKPGTANGAMIPAQIPVSVADSIVKFEKELSGQNPLTGIDWAPFDQKDYNLPVNRAVMITWNKLEAGILSVDFYRITIIRNNESIESAKVRSNSNMIPFGDFKKLETGKEYEAKIWAVLKDNREVEGNSFKFTYK